MQIDNLPPSTFFSWFSDEERDALLKIAVTREISAGQSVFHRGDPGDELYIVMEGAVEIYINDHSGQRIVLSVLGPGDMFGELAVFDGGSRSASAACAVPTKLITFDREALTSFVVSRPHAGLELIKMLASRLRKTDEILRDRVARNVNDAIENKISNTQKLAGKIADWSGSVEFLILNVAVFFVWIVVNLGFVPGIEAFDPFPFGLLTMAVSLEAIFLSICVLLAQNLQTARDRVRGDIEYEVNLRAELEITELHRKLDSHSEKVLERLHRIESLKLPYR